MNSYIIAGLFIAIVWALTLVAAYAKGRADEIRKEEEDFWNAQSEAMCKQGGS